MPTTYYPAIFQEEDTGYSVSFPDLPGCFTEGDTLEEACAMAAEAIGLYLYDHTTGTFSHSCPSVLPDIPTNAGQHLVLIAFDEAAYLKKMDSRAVKKTLTLPSWLNTRAEQAGINFSQTLQSALKEQLGL